MLGGDFTLLNLVKACAFLGFKDESSAATELRHYLEQDSSSERAGKARALLAEIAKQINPIYLSIFGLRNDYLITERFAAAL